MVSTVNEPKVLAGHTVQEEIHSKTDLEQCDRNALSDNLARRHCGGFVERVPPKRIAGKVQHNKDARHKEQHNRHFILR